MKSASHKLSSTVAEQTLTELGGIPIDRMAWRVLGRGEHYERPDRLRMLCFDKCPPKSDRRHGGKVDTDDLSRRRVGQLTVIAYWGQRKGADGRRGQLWICRCLCGLFTIRRADFIVRPRTDVPKCDACVVEEVKRFGFSSETAFAYVDYALPRDQARIVTAKCGYVPTEEKK